MLESASIRASIALAAYAEPLLDGRRVIVFGDSSSALADELLERGARLVHVYDPDTSRVAESATRNTSRNVSIAPLGESGLAVRDGAFDVGFIEDLTLAGPAHSVLKRLRRALSPRGVAIVAAPNPEVRTRLVAGLMVESALDYYQLYDAVSAEFENVRMLGQTPFVGYAVVDFAAAGMPEPSIDTAFVPGGAEEPEWFVALASAMPLRLDEFAVIQLPFGATQITARPVASDAALGRARELDQQSRARAAELEAQVNQLRAELASARRPEPNVEVVRRLEQELAKRDKWIAELEARSAVADARADEVQAELDEERAKHANDAAPVAALEHERDALRAEADVLRARIDEQGRRIQALSQEDSAGSDDLTALEAQLGERGHAVRELERQLREAERVGKELLGEVERLAAVAAEREADLEAARWTIQKLEGSSAPSELVRELEAARAALQRQSVLIGQARHDA